MMRRLTTWLLASALLVGMGGFFALRYIENEYRNYSALRSVQSLIEFHLRNAVDPDFPSSWTDLSNDFESCQPSGFSLKELSERVIVNWEVGSRCFETANLIGPDEAESLLVISLFNGSRGRWHGADPNKNLVTSIREVSRTRNRGLVER